MPLPAIVLAHLLSLIARPAFALRYRIRVTGLEEVVAKGRQGILFLPNHSALIDPAILVTRLHRQFRPRPLADEYQVARTVLGRIALWFGTRVLPSLDRAGAAARDRTRAVLADTINGLASGENVLLYPSGRLKRTHLEDIGSASGVHSIVQSLPSVRIVLVRQDGLWGSSFSFGFRGEMPAVGAALTRAARYLLLNGVFFMPRREVAIELVEPADVPRSGTREVLNKYLEAFYNNRAPRNTYVPYGFWERGGVRQVPEPVYRSSQADASSVAPATRGLVLTQLADMTGREEIGLGQRLSRDLGLDSLAIAELVVWLEREFGFSVGTPDSLQTVADAVLAAAGRGTSAVAADLKPVPAGWFATRAGETRLSVPDAETLTAAVLAMAAARPSQPIIADQASGVRTYRDLILAVHLLKPILERQPGEYVGVMMPASVGAGVLLLGALFAGKTAVMINWTTGVRTIRHSLELLGVSRVITARALLARLATLGIDLAEIGDRFIFVEDILAGIGAMAKLRAAARSRITWQELESVHPRDVAVVLFTSGSESLPKAVPLTHRNLLANIRDVLCMADVYEGDVLLGLLPPFHSFGLTTTVLLPLTVGLRTVYHPNPTESALLVRVLEAYRATITFGTPTFMAGIVRAAAEGQLASLRLAVTGAEKCPDSVRDAIRTRAPGATILEGYGITECSPVVAVNPTTHQVEGSVGRLLPNVEGAVVSLDVERRVEPGDTGMLLVRGPSIFDGYLKHSGDSPFVTFEGHSWYRTGDLVSATLDGYLFFKGRLKRFVKLGGEMISLPAIESVLQAHFGDADDGPTVAVEALGNPDSPDIVLFTRTPADRATVNDLIRQAGLSPLHHIRQIIEVDELPLLGTGKTDYRSLKARFDSQA
ncbi:MAG: AMP-binding protein [Acidobacteriota bacterium]